MPRRRRVRESKNDEAELSMHILLVHNGEAGDAADRAEAIADHICQRGRQVE